MLKPRESAVSKQTKKARTKMVRAFAFQAARPGFAAREVLVAVLGFLFLSLVGDLQVILHAEDARNLIGAKICHIAIRL